jgi:ABC-type bacteriocin/lantibiotic exporter with double-glycine peptidase domain
VFADEQWFWKSTWLDKGDCGPNSLYILMRLYGKNVTLQDVKERLYFDAVKGCAFSEISDAANGFGFSVEIRFVRPNELSQVQRPFILHGITSREKNIGHYIVVVDFDSKKRVYTFIDPMLESYTQNPEASVPYNYSGYVLIPQYTAPHFWNMLTGFCLITIGIISVVLIVFYRKEISIGNTIVNHSAPTT